MTTATAYTLENRRKLVAGATIGLTAEQIEAIAIRCQEQDAAGGNASVWHNVHSVLNTPDCHCFACASVRAVRT